MIFDRYKTCIIPFVCSSIHLLSHHHNSSSSFYFNGTNNNITCKSLWRSVSFPGNRTTKSNSNIKKEREKNAQNHYSAHNVILSVQMWTTSFLFENCKHAATAHTHTHSHRTHKHQKWHPICFYDAYKCIATQENWTYQSSIVHSFKFMSSYTMLSISIIQNMNM